MAPRNRSRKTTTKTIIIRVRVQHEKPRALVRAALDYGSLHTLHEMITDGIVDLSAEWAHHAATDPYAEVKAKEPARIVGKVTVAEQRGGLS